MWSSEAGNSARKEYLQKQQKGLNAKASPFKSKADPLELLIEDLSLNDAEDIRSGATTQERSVRPEEQSGLASIDTLNEWDHAFPQLNRRSPSQNLSHSSIDREFEYHSHPNWSSLDIVGPDSPRLNNRGEPFPSRQSSLPSRTFSQDSAAFPIGPARTATYDSYLSPMTNSGYHRPSNTYAPPPASPMASNYFPPQGQLAAARPSTTPGAANKAPRNMDPVDGYVYQVQFKRAHKNYILAPSAPRNIIPGDFVKVEADRGEDMGIVLSKSPSSEFEEVIPTAGYRGRGFSSGQGERKFLFRLATSEERMALVDKVRDEEHALATIREKALERSLPMVILDAEYQFDRHKLTFFFEADRRIDFRELVSELFSQYKTRIWMQQVDTSTLPTSDAGTELARATGFLPKRDDRAYLQAAHALMRGGGGGGVVPGGGGMSSALSPPPQGRVAASLGPPGYGSTDSSARGFANTFGESFPAGLGGVPYGGPTSGRAPGPTDRRGGGGGAADPWMFSGHH